MAKVVQENFGEKIIEAVRDFAKTDLKSVGDLEADEFSHVSDDRLREALATTFYGTRWLYKVGLALLVRDAEQLAHVRAQVMDYGGVCEGLLSDALLHALRTGRLRGTKYQFFKFGDPKARINWGVLDPLSQLTRQSFFWHIEVAAEEGIIDARLQSRLDTMRKERNTVHMRARTYNAFLGTSKALFASTIATIHQTKAWRRANP
jgi:hypothetical protein